MFHSIILILSPPIDCVNTGKPDIFRGAEDFAAEKQSHRYGFIITMGPSNHIMLLRLLLFCFFARAALYPASVSIFPIASIAAALIGYAMGDAVRSGWVAAWKVFRSAAVIPC